MEDDVETLIALVPNLIMRPPLRLLFQTGKRKIRNFKGGLYT